MTRIDRDAAPAYDEYLQDRATYLAELKVESDENDANVATTEDFERKAEYEKELEGLREVSHKCNDIATFDLYVSDNGLRYLLSEADIFELREQLGELLDAAYDFYDFPTVSDIIDNTAASPLDEYRDPHYWVD